MRAASKRSRRDAKTCSEEDERLRQEKEREREWDGDGDELRRTEEKEKDGSVRQVGALEGGEREGRDGRRI